MSAINDVVRWARVGPRWLGHRPEPLIHERLWACPLVAAPTGDGWLHEAGFDADGRAVALRVTAPAPDSAHSSYTEVTRRGEHHIEMSIEHGDTTLRTELDDAGRPLRTIYSGDVEDEETYRWGDGARLVAIREAEGLWDVALIGARNETGGELRIDHDALGPLRITSSRNVVWERPDTPWAAALTTGAAAIRDGVVEITERACRAAGIGATTQVFSLMLVYVAGSGLHVLTCWGLEDERRRWLAARLDDHELACNLWEPEPDGPGRALYLMDEPALGDEADRALLCQAATRQPDDPQRVVLNAAASLLATHDWSGLLTPTADFVAYIAEHDEGFAPKHESVRAVNPPQRLAAWDAAWPRRASRGEDERRSAWTGA